MWRLFGEFLLHTNFQSLPILAIAGLQEHGGVRGEARFPPNVAIIWGIFITYQFPIIANIGKLRRYRSMGGLGGKCASPRMGG